MDAFVAVDWGTTNRRAWRIDGASAVEDVSDSMGVSRITVYNYLNAIHR